MPFMEPYAPLLRLFKGMTRKAPGSEASTLRALAACALPPEPGVADLGCGAGASALVLARELRVPVLAVDADGLALDDLWEGACARGLLPLIEARCGDLADPGIAPESLDLLWSEGAIAHAGWARALPAWHRLLRSGGVLACTDATWFQDDPPAEARHAWDQWYPEIATEAARLRAAQAAGFQVVEHFRLPSREWWDYFDQVEERCRLHAEDPGLTEVIAAMHHEMDLYRRVGHSYGYVFYVLRKP
jgi:serine/threonine-protein kinase HipA